MRSAGPVTRAGDDDRRVRFEPVYAANYEPILAYALRRTETAEDAADVVAETFLTAWRRLDEAPPGAEMRLWLYGVARLVLANQRRARRRHERLGARLRTAGQPDTVAPAADGEPGGAIACAFRRLRAEDREVLGLLAVEGLRPNEIAQVLGRSAATVRVRLYRARRRFARELAAEGVEV